MMQSRMKNAVQLIPGVVEAMYALSQIVEKSGIGRKVVNLAQLRASQINGCGVCVDMHARLMKMEGETDERIFAVSAWFDAPYFSDAERAALALAEATTRISDRTDPVTDEVWNEAKKHFSEKELAGLLLAIGVINVWNRFNVATRQVAGEWLKSAEAKGWLETHAQAVK